jgi:methionyl-tRNA formyltransferase
MKIVILTSSEYGTAAHHLPYLTDANSCEVTMVIFNEDKAYNKNKHFKQKLAKIFRIGILGALNGIRMRKWFIESKDAPIESLESICRQKNIPFYRTPTINCARTRELFHQSGADLGLSLGNGYIGSKLFSIPQYGMINIHHELLPEFQNAQSIIWQLYNMSAKTGYTIHKIDKHIDTGDILYKAYVPINFLPTLSATIINTSALLLKASAKGLVYVIEHFDMLYQQATPQEKGHSYTTPTIGQYFRIVRNFRKLKKAANLGLPL